ncbi:MAG: TolC family protein [Armatimonadetes bacterium]|nr:TolC family protein [Armatimonadota bacterium]MDE2206839.1 TolC family protein [Armatimonadota bacterium]
MLVLACAVSAHATQQPTPGAMKISDLVTEALAQAPEPREYRYAFLAGVTRLEPERPTASPSLRADLRGGIQTPSLHFPRPDEAPATVLSSDASSFSLTYRQPVYRAGLRPAAARYRADEMVLQLEYRQALLDFAWSVRSACIGRLEADDALAVAEDSLEGAKRYEKLVHGQIAAGAARPIDAQTAAAQTAEARSALESARSAALLARLNLNRLLGRPISSASRILPPQPVGAPPSEPDDAIKMGESSSTELAILNCEITAARAGESLAHLQAAPALDFEARVVEQAPTALAPENYAAAFLELSAPLLGGSAARSDAKAAREEAGRLAAARDAALAGVAVDITSAWRRYVEAWAQQDLAKRRQSAADAELKLDEAAYAIGRSSAVDVESARREARRAAMQTVQARWQVVRANWDLAYHEGAASAAIDRLAPADAPGR